MLREQGTLLVLSVILTNLWHYLAVQEDYCSDGEGKRCLNGYKDIKKTMVRAWATGMQSRDC